MFVLCAILSHNMKCKHRQALHLPPRYMTLSHLPGSVQGAAIQQGLPIQSTLDLQPGLDGVAGVCTSCVKLRDRSGSHPCEQPATTRQSG